MQYFVASNLTHDGKVYERGTTIEFGDHDSAARRLLEIGVIQVHAIGEAQVTAPEIGEPPVGTGH